MRMVKSINRRRDDFHSTTIVYLVTDPHEPDGVTEGITFRGN
jgi:hypothetical protein